MTQTNILIMPSKDESLPNAVREAMAIGLTVLVSAAGGMPEIVIDGETGWALTMEKLSQWAYRIRRCHDNRDASEAIGQNASVYAFKFFDTEHGGAEYARIITVQFPQQRSKGKR